MCEALFPRYGKAVPVSVHIMQLNHLIRTEIHSNFLLSSKNRNVRAKTPQQPRWKKNTHTIISIIKSFFSQL